MFLLKSTLGLFGIALLGISLFGWYELVFWQYVPSLWLFLILLLILFIGLGIVQYLILTPLEMSFIARQSYIHDNPYTEDVRVIRQILEEQFPAAKNELTDAEKHLTEPGEWEEHHGIVLQPQAHTPAPPSDQG